MDRYGCHSSTPFEALAKQPLLMKTVYYRGKKIFDYNDFY